MDSLQENRRREFIWYHMNGDGDCNGQVLRAYAQNSALSAQDCFDLAYFYAITYCCASAVFLLDRRKDIIDDCRGFAEEYKSKLVFQSDRKYVKMLDNFYRVLEFWREKLKSCEPVYSENNVNNGILLTKKALRESESWYYFSRFSAYLFVETYCDIHGLQAQRETGLKYDGDNMTFAGGLFYVFGLDEEAAFVQKNHKLPVDNDTFEYILGDLQNAVKQAGGDDNFTKLETSLCAYEKFFKGTRYNGYYADRQLEELVKMSKVPEFSTACAKLYDARAQAIPVEYRGEANGWDGIRPAMKKGYKDGQGIQGYNSKDLRQSAMDGGNC